VISCPKYYELTLDSLPVIQNFTLQLHDELISLDLAFTFLQTVVPGSVESSPVAWKIRVRSLPHYFFILLSF
jgi:hypothetical protein